MNFNSIVPLKLLLKNSLVGPIIGKEGAVIDSIRTETETNINISKLNAKRGDGERIITIRGGLVNVFRALRSIDEKVIVREQGEQGETRMDEL